MSQVRCRPEAGPEARLRRPERALRVEVPCEPAVEVRLARSEQQEPGRPSARRLEEEVRPSVQRAAVAAEQPSVALAEEVVVQPSARPEVAAQPWEPQVVAEEQPSAGQVAAVEVLRAAEPAAVAGQPSEVRVVEAERPWAALAAEREPPSAAQVVLLSAAPSVRSDPPVRRLARQRTTTFRREPEAAKPEGRRSQLSSAE